MVVFGLAAACSPAGLSRQQVKDGYRAQLVTQGVAAVEAKCITDGFFDHLTDEQLRAFQMRDVLSSQDRSMFGALATTCATTGT